ncbi:MAG: hypothetical protein AAFY26_03155 [Cyanobacteria bacterium J06638_22]
MANFILTAGQDIITGTSGDDIFFANGGSLNPGDQINGGAGFDIFDFSGNASGTFAGFQLNGIERFEAFVASGASITFDLSGSNNVVQLVSRFTEGRVRWDNVDVAANDLFALDTVTGADLGVDYLASQTTGANDVVNVFVDSAGLAQLDIEAGSNTLAIETLNITAIDGSTIIGELDSRHVTLNFFGSGNIEIDLPLKDTLKTVDATGLAGNLDLDFTGNDGASAGVTVTGSAGTNRIDAGEADDVITTFGGRDKITSEGGEDVVRAGADRDAIVVKNWSGPEAVTLFGEGGNDVFDLKDGFDEDDMIDGGMGNDELRAEGDVADMDFAGVTSVEIYTQNEGGTSTLGAMAQAAGINQIRFDRTGADDNVIDASGMTNDLKFIANYGSSLTGGGADILIGGSGDDLFNLAAGYGDSDMIDGGPGFDEIKLRGDTATSAAASDLKNIELITLGSAVGNKPGNVNGNTYSIVISPATSPEGGVLTIDATELQGTLGETLSTSFLGGITFSMHLLGGSGNDALQSDAGNDVLIGGAGNDFMNGFIGQDIFIGGPGADSINLGQNGPPDTDADIAVYQSIADSSPSAEGRDFIGSFVSGIDMIDLTNVVEASGLGVIQFLGNFSSISDANAQVEAGSGDLQVAYVEPGIFGFGILYADVNDDGIFNGNDIQIELLLVGALSAADVLDGESITATAAPATAIVSSADLLPQEVALLPGTDMMMPHL